MRGTLMVSTLNHCAARQSLMNGRTGMQKRVRFVSAVILIVHAILSSAAFAAEGKVVWYTWSNPVENAWQRRAIADFRKVNSEITIEHMITPWDQYDQKLTMLFAAETPPDLFSNWAWNGFMDMTLRGMTKQLDPLIERTGFDTSVFHPYAVEYYRYDGKLYGLPLMMAPSALWYNADLFDDAGLAYPTVDPHDPDWNWDALVALAQKLTVDRNGDGRIDQFGINAPYGMWGGLPSVVQLFGGDVFPEEAYETGVVRRASLADNPVALEAVTAITDLIYTHRVAPTPAEGEAMSALGDPFRTGRLAMNMTGGWGWWTYGDIQSFTVRAAAQPWGNPDRRREIVVGADPWLIASTSRNVDATWEFVQWLLSEESQKVAIEAMGMPSARMDLFEYWFQRWPQHTPEELNTLFVGSLDYGRPAADHRLLGYLELGKAMESALELVGLGRATPAQGLADAQERVDRILAGRNQ